MTLFRSILACAALTTSLVAQDISPKDEHLDPVLSALSGGLDDQEGPSVTVDISASAPNLLSEETEQPRSEDDGNAGKFSPKDEAPDLSEAQAPQPEGVTVTVEPGSAGSPAVDASSVKLLAPFPAKPLNAPPAGWRLEHPKEVPAFVREVPLSNGTKISLSIRPHLLVPDADGENVIAVKEPGYEPALRYAQTATITATLSDSLERMDQDSRKMSEAIERLGQLLSSLPATPAPVESAPQPAKNSR